MFFRRTKDSDSVFKSILAAHAILLLHVFLIAGIGFLVFFFGGLIHHMGWVFLAGAGIVLAVGYRHYRRVTREGKTAYEMMRPSLLKGRPVEFSVLGGLIAFKVGGSHSNRKQIEPLPGTETPLLEDPHAKPMDALAELVRLLECGLITRDEYDRAKKTLFHS